MRRFWQEVRVVSRDAGTGLELDGRPLRTPAGQPLVVPSVALATTIAAEWRVQEETVDPVTMPATRLASTVVDRLPALRTAAIDELVGIVRTDLVLYRADRPDDLVLRQEEAWQPILSWLCARYDVDLGVTRWLVPVDQPAASIRRLRAVVERLDDWRLVGLHAAAQPLGSLALGLALAERVVSADEAADRSLLDELYEIETWGWEVEVDRRHRALRADVEAAARFLMALDDPDEAVAG